MNEFWQANFGGLLSTVLWIVNLVPRAFSEGERKALVWAGHVKENCPLFGQFYYVLKYNLCANENKLGINLRGDFTRNIIRIFGLILKELLRTEKCSQCICSMSQYTIGMGENSAPYVLKRIHHVMNNATFPSFNLKLSKASFLLRITFIEARCDRCFPYWIRKIFYFSCSAGFIPSKDDRIWEYCHGCLSPEFHCENQINVLMSREISADVLRISEHMDTQSSTLFNNSMNVETECQIPDKIINGEYKILFCHPKQRW